MVFNRSSEKQAKMSALVGAYLIGVICVAIGALLASGCGGGGSNGDQFLGQWQGSEGCITITKDGALFIVDATKASLREKYTAKLVKGSLQLNPSTLGEANLSADGKKIYCAGYEWLKQKTFDELDKTLTVDLGGGVKMELILIRPGSFMMGSEKGKPSEKPVHKVTIATPFYLGKYEVTQEQWEKVMGSNPSNFKGPKMPVEHVSWIDCQEFLKKLNASTAGGGRFSMPSEAQWEYACRAGSTTEYCYGDDAGGFGDYAWFDPNSGNTTHPVGEKKPNAWGFYDMHGNVWEWCQDGYHTSYDGAPTDGSAWETQPKVRVLRGGAFPYDASYCRSAFRFNPYPPGYRGNDGDGLRVVRTP